MYPFLSLFALLLILDFSSLASPSGKQDLPVLPRPIFSDRRFVIGSSDVGDGGSDNGAGDAAASGGAGGELGVGGGGAGGGSSGDHGDVSPEDAELVCASWRFAGEANNLAPWGTVPPECGTYVRKYMTGKAYDLDLQIVAREAASFARSLTLAGDGKDAWVFDVDDTLLSNLPYYAGHGYGLELFNASEFDKWIKKAAAPAVNYSLKLYNDVLNLGFKVFVLTGRSEAQRDLTTRNLNSAGFQVWERLILR
ncbi:hypothetical protein HPP92_012922 [Vanilla planifolia]|uniref:Acid phosphatase n=1 Tax=Vanilla planifolia TaxID=51239 RepID=A0A835UY50_VANPL|nr:hypothetical protein HPP92_012922 [Vanilla planifolia]